MRQGVDLDVFRKALDDEKRKSRESVWLLLAIAREPESIRVQDGRVFISNDAISRLDRGMALQTKAGPTEVELVAVESNGTVSIASPPMGLVN